MKQQNFINQSGKYRWFKNRYPYFDCCDKLCHHSFRCITDTLYSQLKRLRYMKWFYSLLKLKKIGICSVSKSTIDALLNVANNTLLLNNIKEIEDQHKNVIKVMWIPLHASIRIDQYANERSKRTTTFICTLYSERHPQFGKKSNSQILD